MKEVCSNQQEMEDVVEKEAKAMQLQTGKLYTFRRLKLFDKEESV